MSSSAPASLLISANRLMHHVLEWAPAVAPRGVVVLVHGFMDAAGTWDHVAPSLAAAGFRVLAPDMRGFGRAPRVSGGGYYHFSDYVFDLADVIDALSPDAPVALVGHSMGGTVVTLVSGAFPERVTRLVTIEGLGPPDNAAEVAPARMRSWIDGVRAVRRRELEAPVSREDAFRRLCLKHPSVPVEVLRTRLEHLVEEREEEEADGGGGGVRWRFDPLHRTTAPVPFFARVFVEFARKITCPVLFVSGGPEGFHPADEETRLAAFAHLSRVEIAGAGHMVHWTRPDELASELVTFLGA